MAIKFVWNTMPKSKYGLGKLFAMKATLVKKGIPR